MQVNRIIVIIEPKNLHSEFLIRSVRIIRVNHSCISSASVEWQKYGLNRSRLSTRNSKLSLVSSWISAYLRTLQHNIIRDILGFLLPECVDFRWVNFRTPKAVFRNPDRPIWVRNFVSVAKKVCVTIIMFPFINLKQILTHFVWFYTVARNKNFRL